MLNQAAGDRQILAQQLNISPHQLSYVTHSGEGQGLLFYGNVILPFVDRFPTDLELYKIMTTKLSEVQDAGTAASQAAGARNAGIPGNGDLTSAHMSNRGDRGYEEGGNASGCSSREA